MKAISIWSPFAQLIVRGYKLFETRTWPAPRGVLGQRIAIASTKVIQPAQKAHFADPHFQGFYERLGLPDSITAMHNGFVLGTAVIAGVEPMTPEFLDDVSNEEKAYGWWQEGGYAWRMADPVCFETPIPVRGAQGLWEWSPSTASDVSVLVPAEKACRGRLT